MVLDQKDPIDNNLGKIEFRTVGSQDNDFIIDDQQLCD